MGQWVGGQWISEHAVQVVDRERVRQTGRRQKGWRERVELVDGSWLLGLGLGGDWSQRCKVFGQRLKGIWGNLNNFAVT